MKRAIPGDELPFIHNTDRQLEYRFPFSVNMSNFLSARDILHNLIGNLGGRLSILIKTPIPHVIPEYVETCHIDYIKTRNSMMLDWCDRSDLDALSRHYDVIQSRCVGWNAEFFEICQKNRCLIMCNRNIHWYPNTGNWSRGSPISMGSFVSPTGLTEDEHDNLLCDDAVVYPTGHWSHGELENLPLFTR